MLTSKMAASCGICEANIHSNSESIQCKKCEKWIHKRCTGLVNEDYAKVTRQVKKMV